MNCYSHIILTVFIIGMFFGCRAKISEESIYLIDFTPSKYFNLDERYRIEYTVTCIVERIEQSSTINDSFTPDADYTKPGITLFKIIDGDRFPDIDKYTHFRAIGGFDGLNKGQQVKFFFDVDRHCMKHEVKSTDFRK